MKKILLGIGALAVAIIAVPMFAAFEAHVINVTAVIENALAVSVSALDFGTVFPQEHLEKQVNVSLSQSFIAEGRVDDVDYFIRQKPKCAITSNNGQSFDPVNTATGHVIPNVATPNDPNDFIVDCGTAPRELVNGEVWGVLPSLCEYISKDPDDVDDNNENPGATGGGANDGSLASFHAPFTFLNGSVSWLDTSGRLAKSQNDTADDWTIDLAVPCFGEHCAQDWLGFVRRISGNQDLTQAQADAFAQPIANEHKVFGCDLWIEVKNVSETPRPTVGANLSAYQAPLVCNVTVTQGGLDPDTIAEGIVAASAGETVCVAPGTYAESVDIDKSLTLASIGGPGTTTIAGGVNVGADNVVVTGFTVNPAAIGIGPTVAGFFLQDAADNATIRDNDIDGTGVSNVGGTRGIILAAGGTFSNILIENNEIHDFTSGIYLEYQHAGTPITIRENDIEVDNPADNGAGASAGIGALGGALVTLNEFTGELADLEAIGVVDPFYGGQPIEFNNFLNGSKIVDYGTTPVIDAENNFFGPNGGTVQAVGSDFTPEEGSAFLHN